MIDADVGPNPDDTHDRRQAHATQAHGLKYAYHVRNGAIVQTDIKQSDGTSTKYTYNENRYPTSETWSHPDYQPASFTYARDPVTSYATAMTVTCPDRSGRPLRHSSHVRPGYEEWTKWDLLQTHCSWSNWRREREAAKRSAGKQEFGPR
jgi:hypothetical protein